MMQPQVTAKPTQPSTQQPPSTPVPAGPEEAVDKITMAIEEQMSSLPDNQKAAVMAHLTPEIADVLGIILGPEAHQYFRRMADDSMMLVPIPREEAMALRESQQAQQMEAQESSPVAPRPPASTGNPPSSLMGV